MSLNGRFNDTVGNACIAVIMIIIGIGGDNIILILFLLPSLSLG